VVKSARITFLEQPAMSPIEHKKPLNDCRWLFLCATAVLISGCGISAETQALIDEFNSTIPECQGTADCTAKWEAARNWVITTPSYGIRVANENRIETYDADNTRAGTAIQVTRESLGGDRYRLVVDIDCFAASGCPPYWETKIDFNRTVGSVGR
jgi:hypothetical protein